MRVRQYIENTIDCSPERISHRQISAATGVCVSLLSRYFSGSKDLTFADLLKITQLVPQVDEDKALELMIDDYIESARPANKRALMLYLLTQGRFDRLDELAATLTSGREYRAWGSLFEAFVKFHRGELADFELSEYVTTIRVENAELTAFKYFLVAYDMNATNSHNVAVHYTAKAERALHDIESNDLRQQISDLLTGLQVAA